MYSLLASIKCLLPFGKIVKDVKCLYSFGYFETDDIVMW